MDDLYNNLKVYEAEMKGQSSSTLNSQNGQAFALTYVDDVIFFFFANQSNSPQLDTEDLEQIDTDDLEEMDLKWQVAMLTMRVKIFIKKIGRNLNFNGKETVTIGFEKTKGNKSGDNTRRVIPVETPANALLVAGSSSLDTEVHACSKECLQSYQTLQKQYDQQRKVLNKSNLEIIAYQLGLESLEARIVVHQKNEAVFEEDIAFLKYDVKNLTNLINSQISPKDKTGLGYDRLDDYVFKSAMTETVTSVHETETSTSKTSKESMKKSKTVRSSAPIIEDWESDSDDDSVATKSGQVPVNTAKKISPRAAASTCTARYVNTAASRPTVNVVSVIQENREMLLSPQHTGFGDEQEMLLIISPKTVDHTCFKDLTMLIFKEDSGIFYSGCSRHMTGNKSFLTDYQEIDGGFVAFGGSPKGGGLTCLFAKDTIDESNLWHRRLGHINFKTMNKLVRGNLVRVCQMKGIKREFSVARTPQQNGVAERNNRTLIEATRTMLADSLLPIIFWAEAVNTACYVRNRVLVTKPHNKTPYELLIGRSPTPDFLKPFECPITNLNTLDHLGKFEGKANEWSLVGCSVNINAGNQTNDDAGIEINDNAEQAGQEIVSYHEYVLLLLIPSKSPLSLSTQCSDDKDVDEVPGKGDEGVSKGSEIDDKEMTDSSTQVVNTAGLSINTANTNINTGSLNINIVGSNDPSMPSLEETGIFDDVYDDREVGAEADTNNLELSTVVSPIPTTRVHKDHVKEQIIGDLNLATQTKRMITFFEENDMIDVKSAFLYVTIEEEVYVCQSPGFEDPHFPNKVYKVEKALYGLHQAPRAWYKTLSTYLLENRFRRGTIDKTLFIKKDRGLQVKQKDDGIFISQDKYIANILKKFDFTTVKTASTLMKPNKELIKDAEAEDVDVYLYRSMIGSLMYLTASRPDIMFVVCAYARFQVTPKTSHLHVVKRIFKCLKDQTKLGLWYPRDSPFDLEAFFYSDYAEASLDRKSTTGGEGSTVPVESHHTPLGAPTTSEPPLSSPSRIPTRQETEVPQSSSPTHTHVTDKAASIGVDVTHGGVATTVTSLDAGQGSGYINKTSSMPYDSPFLRVHILGSDKGRMQQNELMDLVTKLTDKVLALETDLQQIKKVHSTAFTKLIMKVKKLEKIVKSTKARRRAKIVVSDDEDAAEDSSKQGRKIDEIDQDPNISLVQHDVEVQGRHE
nr:hypothetical protein [Tanacetum cinerariifolium]